MGQTKNRGSKWVACISDRTRVGRNTGCPYCGHHKVLVGFNDLATFYPEIAKEWNYEKNFPLTPQHYIKGTQLPILFKSKSPTRI